MSPRFLVLAAALAALGGCGKKAPPKAASAAKKEQAAQAQAAAPAPEKPADSDWVYSSVGKRDPFRNFLSELSAQTGALATRCATPLGRYEVEQLKLVAVITGLEDPVAMVEAPSGVGYSIRRGACIGKNGGVVAAVRSGEVVISEWAVRADGSRDSTQTVIRLPKQAALNLEE
jgi:type IV pilus assembly protein PilP